jgi:hypothetical protein
MEKKCNWCGEIKPLNKFHRRGPNGRQAVCIPCKQEYDKANYRKKAEHHKGVVAARVQEVKLWARTLKDGPCTDCGGQFHPEAMQWDHVSGSKRWDVGAMTHAGYAKETILKEIAKCELVCANCHAVRTASRRE